MFIRLSDDFICCGYAWIKSKSSRPTCNAEALPPQLITAPIVSIPTFPSKLTNNTSPPRHGPFSRQVRDSDASLHSCTALERFEADLCTVPCSLCPHVTFVILQQACYRWFPKRGRRRCVSPCLLGRKLPRVGIEIEAIGPSRVDTLLLDTRETRFATVLILQDRDGVPSRLVLDARREWYWW